MIFLNHIPFVRILLPFLAGIVYGLTGRLNTSIFVLLAGSFLLCLLGYLFLHFKKNGFYKILYGISTQVFLFLSGCSICFLNDLQNLPDHYSHFLPEQIECFRASIEEIPFEKQKSVKAEINILQLKSKDRWHTASGKLVLYFEKDTQSLKLEPGQVIIFTGTLQEIKAPLNPFEFNFKKYLQERNIFHSVYVPDKSWMVEPTASPFSLLHFSQKIRKDLLQVYKESGLDQRAVALLAALVLGYDDEIDRPLMTAYSHTGTLHVLSVSGLHVGIIYLLLGNLFAFLDAFKKTARLKILLIIVCLWFFVLLSGFSAPAVRAACMFSLILLGKSFFEQVETVNIVLVSAFLSLCINPFWICDIGFQLSYIAVLGILYLYPFFYKLFTFSHSYADKVWALCSVSIAAQIATLPLTLYLFHQFPILFLLTNLILIPLSTLVMYGGMLVLLFAKFPLIAAPLVWLTGVSIKGMNGAALFFDQLPFCVWDNINLSLFQTVLLYVLIILFFTAIEFKSYRLWMSSGILAGLMILISIGLDWKAREEKKCVIYHSERAQVLSVFSGNQYTQIADTFPDERLQSTLRENKIKQDVLHQKYGSLYNNSLICFAHKKILYCTNPMIVNSDRIDSIHPDYIWIPGAVLHSKKLAALSMISGKIIISGKLALAKNDTLPSSYFATARSGAFILDLSE